MAAIRPRVHRVLRQAFSSLCCFVSAGALVTPSCGCGASAASRAAEHEAGLARRQVLAQRDRLEWADDAATSRIAAPGELMEESLPEAPPAPVEPLPAAPVGSEPAPGGLSEGTATVQPPEEESLLPLISGSTPAQHAASLRCVEQGRLLLASGQRERAREWFERALSLDATNPYAYYFLARAALLNQRPDQAETFLARARSFSGGLGPRWQSRFAALQGEIWETVGRFPEARRAYQEATEADPANSAARSGLARLSSP